MWGIQDNEMKCPNVNVETYFKNRNKNFKATFQMSVSLACHSFVYFNTKLKIVNHMEHGTIMPVSSFLCIYTLIKDP